MASLNDALTIARSGVLTHQERLAVISHNIANVDTEGYHRQRALLGTNPPNSPNLYQTRGYDIGTGVRVEDVIRMESTAREDVLLEQFGYLGRNDFLADTLGDLENILDGPGDISLATSLRDFWTGWQDLANNADRMAFRSTVLENSATLAEQFNLLSMRLTDYRNNLAAGGTGPNFTGTIAREVTSINDMTARLQQLNQRITQMESQGRNPNDLKDQRDLLVRQLSQEADVKVAFDYTATLDGQLLVNSDGSIRNTLNLADAGANPIRLQVNGVDVTVSQGKLAGMLESATWADALIADIDTMASELISAVNTIHQSGFDLNGDPGLAFFTGTNAGDIAINPALYDPTNPALNNPQLIAAANTVHDPGPPVVPNVRDGANALEIADLCRAKIAGLNNQTFGDYFTALVADVGAAKQAAEDLASDSGSVIDMLKGAIAAETGVNLDEELIEMISAQRAFQASSRVVTVVDELMNLLINDMAR